jgi:hypothetical protein
VNTETILEIAAHATTAVLGAWLGLLVLTRSSSPTARVFCVVGLSAAAWSTSVIVGRLSVVPDVIAIARSVEELGAALLVAATGHLAVAIAMERRPRTGAARAIAAFYGLNLALAIPTILDPAVSPPNLAVSGEPGAMLFGWTWVIVRLGTVTIGLLLLWDARRRAQADVLRRRQLAAALASVLAGTTGAALRILPGVGEQDPWIGVSFVALALVLASYAVLAAGIFFGPAIASRAFRTSLAGAMLTVGIVAALVLLDGVGRVILGIEAPVLLVLVMVVTLALYEPITARLRSRLFASDPVAGRVATLLAAAGLRGRPSTEGVEPALERVATALDLAGLEVVGVDGVTIARVGTGGSPSIVRPVPLEDDGHRYAELRAGPTRSGRSLSTGDEELLWLSATYVAAAVNAGRREEQQATSLGDLMVERALVEEHATDLQLALESHGAGPAPLRVYALGPFRVERAGSVLGQWGGKKAGSRQAEALFAFLFDRGEQGVAKDEALELIWPDIELEAADLAFHRTLGGLRRTLDPGDTGRSSRTIRFTNDRYRLEARVVEWSDAQHFLELIADVGAVTARGRVERLEEARSLYRGEYLDDCPFYGDSTHVEDHRVMYRERIVDVLLALGSAYEAADDRVAAVGAYREAVRIGGDAAAAARWAVDRLST